MVTRPLAKVLIFENGGKIAFLDRVADVVIVHREGIQDLLGRSPLGGNSELVFVLVDDGELGEVDAGGVVDEVDLLVPFSDVTFIDPFFKPGKNGLLFGICHSAGEVVLESLYLCDGPGIANSGEHEVSEADAEDESESSSRHSKSSGANLAVFIALSGEEAEDHADETDADDEGENSDGNGHPGFGFGDDILGEAESVVVSPKSGECSDRERDEIEEELYEILEKPEHGKQCENDSDNRIGGEGLHGAGKVAREWGLGKPVCRECLFRMRESGGNGLSWRMFPAPVVAMRLAIGDIHGCLRSLEKMFDFVQPKAGDLVVTLGDYVDRGPDSKGVIQLLLEFQKSHENFVPLMGNHEIQMIRALETKHDRERFLSGLCGGQDTLDSYGGTFDDVPEEHWEFMRSAGLYHELEDHILVHAGLEASIPVDEQDRETYYYHRFYSQEPHVSGKTVVCGHTIQGEVPTNLGYAVCLDTCAYGGGWLSALDLDSGKIWQTNERGQSREMNLGDLS